MSDVAGRIGPRYGRRAGLRRTATAIVHRDPDKPEFIVAAPPSSFAKLLDFAFFLESPKPFTAGLSSFNTSRRQRPVPSRISARRHVRSARPPYIGAGTIQGQPIDARTDGVRRSAPCSTENGDWPKRAFFAGRHARANRVGRVSAPQRTQGKGVPTAICPACAFDSVLVRECLAKESRASPGRRRRRCAPAPHHFPINDTVRLRLLPKKEKPSGSTTHGARSVGADPRRERLKIGWLVDGVKISERCGLCRRTCNPSRACTALAAVQRQRSRNSSASKNRAVQRCRRTAPESGRVHRHRPPADPARVGSSIHVVPRGQTDC